MTWVKQEVVVSPLLRSGCTRLDTTLLPKCERNLRISFLWPAHKTLQSEKNERLAASQLLVFYVCTVVIFFKIYIHVNQQIDRRAATFIYTLNNVQVYCCLYSIQCKVKHWRFTDVLRNSRLKKKKAIYHSIWSSSGKQLNVQNLNDAWKMRLVWYW